MNSAVIGNLKLLGYLREDELGGDVGILLQVRIAEANESHHRGREETGLRERACKNTRIMRSRTYKNEDSVSASLPILHVFFVFKLFYTGDIHSEDSPRGISMNIFLRSSSIMACIL